MVEHCPNEQAVDDFIARRVLPGDAAAFERHLDRCDSCRELVSALVLARGSEPAVDALASTIRPISALACSHGGDDYDGDDDDDADPELAAGHRLGRFVVAERLGSGGMGVVYAAHDPALDRRVAVKLLKDRAAGSRLVREGQALAQLSHPHVVAVYDVGVDAGRAFIAMELVDGTTLTEWLRGKRRRDETIELFLQAGRGLAAAHEAGFIHRDFKPDNVLIGRDGRARVTDFGLARLDESSEETGRGPAETMRGRERTETTDSVATVLRAHTHLTRTGMIVGTPAYMAPEQLDGRVVDASADQFAFCVALFEALCGERPFRGADITALRESIASGRPRDSCAMPPRLRRIVLRGLSEQPADRFGSMHALLDVLAREHQRPARAKRAIVAAGGVIAVLSIVGWAASGRTADDPCPDATARLVGIWDEPTKRSIERAFLATTRPHAASAWNTIEWMIDGYARNWLAMHKESCEATAVHHDQSAELLDRRTSCLAARASELRALSEQFVHADAATVDRAALAAAALSDLGDCANRAALTPSALPIAPAFRARAAALDRELADANALWHLGKAAPAMKASEAAVAMARGLGYPPMLARALVQLGNSRIAFDAAGAKSTLWEAAQVAETAGLDAIKADALNGLLVAKIAGGGALDDTLATAEDARAVIRRIGGDPEREARRLHRVSEAYLAAGTFDAALTNAVAALELGEKLASPEPRANAEFQVGAVLHELGRLDEAFVHQDRSLKLLEAWLGPDHPNVAAALHNNALALQEQGKLVEAKARFERSLRILEGAFGVDSDEVAQSLAALGATFGYLGELEPASRNLTRARAIYAKLHGADDPAMLDSLGRIERDRGRFEDALALHEQALELRRKQLGSDDPDVAISHLNLGQLFTTRERFVEAAGHYREALRITEKQLGREATGLLLVLELVGETEVALHHHRDAIAVLERAVAVGEAAPGNRPITLAAARFHLARALWEVGEHGRARRLAEAAVLGSGESDPSAAKQHALVTAWLAAHR